VNTAFVETTDRLELTGRVREELSDLMEIDRYSWDERGTLTLRGRLSGPADALYRAIRTRMERLGFTPFLRHDAAGDELVAMPGVIERRAPRIWLPVALFLATIVTVMMTGAINSGVDVFSDPRGIIAGLPFAVTLLGILFTHEMGHYVVGRLRHAPVSLPYFIPMPPGISLIGTMGAVIVQREPMEDRRTVLEVGIAGPLAGLVVAIPLLLYGLTVSTIGSPTPEMLASGYIQEGNSLLYIAAKWLVFGRFLPSAGMDVQLSPIAWGAWIGLLVTMLNMLPIGQLDGGHVAYALLGRKADYLAYATIAICVLLGLLISQNYTLLFLPLLALVFGPRHPAPLNDISRLSGRHIALAIVGLCVFVLLFMPAPLMIVTP
jgi:membrane-associated protease RseP (regulator of RpoE activity)